MLPSLFLLGFDDFTQSSDDDLANLWFFVPKIPKAGPFQFGDLVGFFVHVAH